MTVQSIGIYSQSIPLVASFEKEQSTVKIVADKTMLYYALWGMELSLLKIKAKKSLMVFTSGAAIATGSAMMSMGFDGLGHIIPAYSCMALYLGAIVITGVKAVSSAINMGKLRDVKAKLADIFDTTGKLKNIRGENGMTFASAALSYWSVCHKQSLSPNKEKERERSLLGWCEFLLRKGLPLNSAASKEDLLYQAIVYNCLPLAQVLIKKGAKTDFLNSLTDSWILLKHLKRERSNIQKWYTLLPLLKEKANLYTGLKVLSHAFEVDFCPKSAEVLSDFDCFGWSSQLAAKKILKIYKKIHSELSYPSDPHQIIECSLLNLIEEKYSLEEQNLCLLMDIGYKGNSEGSAGHCIYLWIFDNIFIYADTGMNSCVDLFGIQEPVCIGQFERDKLNPEIFKQLLSINSLTKNESMLKRKELLCDQLGLHEQNKFPFACERQEKGSCSWTGLIACLAAVSYLYMHIESHENNDEAFVVQRYFWAMFNRVLPLCYFDSSKWAEKHFLVSDPQFLPAWQEIGAKIRQNWILKEILSIPQSAEEEVSLFNLTVKFKVCTALDTIDAIVNGLKNHMKIE